MILATMVTFPSLPTDNLYKFIAIAGAAMVIAANVISAQTVASMLEQREAVRQRHYDRFDAQRWTHIQNTKTDYPELSPNKATEKAIAQLNSEAAKDWAENGQMRVFEIQSEAMHTVLMLQRMEWSGYGLTLLGFILWWIKVQRFQDSILRLEYETDKDAYTKVHPAGLPTPIRSRLHKLWIWLGSTLYSICKQISAWWSWFRDRFS